MGSDTIGERLRTVRKRHGLRQEDLAARVGVHPKTLSRWENDAQPPEADALERAAAELGVTEQWLRYVARWDQEAAAWLTFGLYVLLINAGYFMGAD